jgi:small subunit ribosomal protein S5
VIGTNCASRDIIRRASPGTVEIDVCGIRAVIDSVGMHDVVAKSIKSGGVYNVLAATFDAFANLNTPGSVAKRRGLHLEQVSTRNQVKVG